MHPDRREVEEFRSIVWDHYASKGRTMPWRENTDPYWVVVSEIMLQQTQVRRVTPKFLAFIRTFPTVNALANASLAEVLQQWSGLGYNRRAKFLWEAARQIMQHYGGDMPRTVEQYDKLPGIGKNTAAAIVAYAYDEPTVFIETNIRTVLIHHFFPDEDKVDDSRLMTVAEKVLDKESPREWYWALMDYGTFLKATHGGRLSQSAHYKRQGPLAGSMREMRGRIIKILAVSSGLSDQQLRSAAQADDRYEPALAALVREGMVSESKGVLSLTGRPGATIIGGHS